MAAPLTAPPDPHPWPPKVRLPPLACDCHLHFFGPASKYPWAQDARYTSAEATPETYFGVQRVLGLERAVVVSGGAYGTDYRLLADALARYPQRLRGVILPPADLGAAEIRRLDALGVRGVRFISAQRFAHLPPLEPALAQRVFDAAGWQVHFYPGGDLEAEATRLLALPNTVVLDHFAGTDAARPSLDVLKRMLDSGKVWVKLSGPMRCTKAEPPYPELTPIARALVAHAPGRMIWGSDWPHVNMTGRTMPNDGDLVDLLAEWVPDEAPRKRILVDNPAALFRF